MYICTDGILIDYTKQTQAMSLGLFRIYLGLHINCKLTLSHVDQASLLLKYEFH